MQQRPTSSSSRALDEWIIDIPPEPQAKHPPRRRMDDMGDRLLGFFNRKILRSPEKWIHVIPVILLICLFVLWCFSYPVKLVIKDGKLAAIHQIKMPVLLNDIDVAILAAAAISPIASDSLNLTSNNETEGPPPASKSDCRTVSRICFFQLCVGTCLQEIRVLQEHF